MKIDNPKSFAAPLHESAPFRTRAYRIDLIGPPIVDVLVHWISCGQSINFLAWIIKQAPSRTFYMESPDTPQQRRVLSAPRKSIFSDMDLFTIGAIAIVVVLLITIVVMGGGYADADQRSFDSAATDERKTSDRADPTATDGSTGTSSLGIEANAALTTAGAASTTRCGVAGNAHSCC